MGKHKHLAVLWPYSSKHVLEGLVGTRLAGAEVGRVEITYALECSTRSRHGSSMPPAVAIILAAGVSAQQSSLWIPYALFPPGTFYPIATGYTFII